MAKIWHKFCPITNGNSWNLGKYIWPWTLTWKAPEFNQLKSLQIKKENQTNKPKTLPLWQRQKIKKSLDTFVGTCTHNSIVLTEITLQRWPARAVWFKAFVWLYNLPFRQNFSGNGNSQQRANFIFYCFIAEETKSWTNTVKGKFKFPQTSWGTREKTPFTWPAELFHWAGLIFHGCSKK